MLADIEKLTKRQAKKAQVQAVQLLQIHNNLSYRDGVISGVQGVTVDFKHTDEGGLIVADVAFKFSGEFKGDTFNFIDITPIDTNITVYSKEVLDERFIGVDFPLSDEHTNTAKNVISTHIESKLHHILDGFITNSDDRTVTPKTAKLADGVTLMENDTTSMNELGDIPDRSGSAWFNINNIATFVDYDLKLGKHFTPRVFNKDFEMIKNSDAEIYLNWFVSPLLDLSNDYYDRSITIEQRISIANFLINEAYKNAIAKSKDNIIGVYDTKS